MTTSTARQLLAALLLTIGFAACAAAMAYGQADDAPGLGLIGLALLFSFAFGAFRVSSRIS